MHGAFRRILVLSTLFSIGIVLSFAPAAATLQSLQTGMEAPDFSLKSPTNQTKTFADVKGEKLTVLVFWSTWSSKSEKVLARMEQLHEKYKAQGLSIVAVNVDEQHVSAETLTRIQEMTGKLNISFPVLIDHGLVVFHDYGVIALPTTVILDKDRIIRDELSGFPLVGSETMIDFITTAIEGKKTEIVQQKEKYQPNKNALRFYNMAKKMSRSKRTVDSAEMWFRKAAEADPSFVLPYVSLGQLYLHKGDRVSAEASFREALTREPGNPIALCELGMILLTDGKGNEALSLFETARKSEDAYAPCYYYTAYAMAKQGNQKEAARLFDEAEKINPFDYKIFVFRARMLEEQKDLNGAFVAYKKAMELILQADERRSL
jgi:peroxiredoxin/Tfp pilus assembly protein PilF